MALGPDDKKLLRNQPALLKPDGMPMDQLTTLFAMMQTAIVDEVNDTSAASSKICQRKVHEALDWLQGV